MKEKGFFERSEAQGPTWQDADPPHIEGTHDVFGVEANDSAAQHIVSKLKFTFDRFVSIS